MIQEINAMSSVINGGYYYQPHLVTKVLDSNGGTIKTISPILLKQTISSRISSDIRSYMALSVQQGTSRHSKVQGYSSGGKQVQRRNTREETENIWFLLLDLLL